VHTRDYNIDDVVQQNSVCERDEFCANYCILCTLNVQLCGSEIAKIMCKLMRVHNRIISQSV